MILYLSNGDANKKYRTFYFYNEHAKRCNIELNTFQIFILYMHYINRARGNNILQKKHDDYDLLKNNDSM